MRGFLPILPGTGRGTSRRLVEGALHGRCIAGIAPSTTASRRSPSPFRGGIATLAVLLANPAFAETIAITNAKLVIGDGAGPVDGGTVVIRDGRVAAAGGGVAVPPGAKVVDAQGKWVTPGLVAGFSRLGIVEVDQVAPTADSAAKDTPFNAAIDITPAVNPRETPIAINRAAGVTRAIVAPDTSNSIFGGQGAVIDLGVGMNDITRPRAFQYAEFGEAGAKLAGGSRPAEFVMFRNALDAAKAYARNPAAYPGEGKDTLVKRIDAAALVPVVEGRQKLMIHVERASDILQVLDLKRQYPALDLVLVGATEAWTVAAQVAASGVPVIASALADLPASFEQLAATESNIGRLERAGVKVVAIGMLNDNDARQARLVKQYAGNIVAVGRVPGGIGLDWGQAFATIASRPAEAIGLGGQIGVLKPGAHGDVVVWDGDPLELSTGVLAVYIDGVEQPLRNRQTLLRDRYKVPEEGALPKAYERQ